MKQQIELNTILESIEGLKVLSGLPLKAKTAFRISKLVKELDSNLETFNESRKKVIDTYKTESDETDKDGNKLEVIPQENMEDYIKELSALVSEKVEIDVPEIGLDDLGEVEIEARHLSALGWLISDN